MMKSGLQLVIWLLWIVVAISQAPVKPNTSSRKTQIANFIAGGLAGTISSTFTIPLEVVKTQLQSSRIGGRASAVQVFQQILKSDGPKGFFKGLQPMLVGIMPTRAIYFWAYSTSKSALHHKFGDTSVNHLISAFAAGITSNTVSYC